MKFSFLYILLTGILFCSCSADKDSESINGTWKLKHSAARDGQGINFSEGEVTWTFNEQTGTVAIENNIVANNTDALSGIDSGLYYYSTTKQNGNKILVINNVAQGIYAYDNDNLVIRAVAADDVVKIFERQP